VPPQIPAHAIQHDCDKTDLRWMIFVYGRRNDAEIDAPKKAAKAPPA